MRKVTTALVTLGMASTMALGLGATPASAANPACGKGAYPPGQPFVAGVSPATAALKVGKSLPIAVFTHKANKPCGKQRLTFQVATPGKSFGGGAIVYTTTNGHGFSYFKAAVKGVNTVRYVWVTPAGGTVVSKATITVS